MTFPPGRDAVDVAAVLTAAGARRQPGFEARHDVKAIAVCHYRRALSSDRQHALSARAEPRHVERQQEKKLGPGYLTTRSVFRCATSDSSRDVR